MRTRGLAMLLLGAGLALALPASGEELYAVVERTTTPGDRALVEISSDRPGPLRVLAYRVEHPQVLLEAGLELRRGQELGARCAAALRLAQPAGESALEEAPAPKVPAAAPLDPGFTFVARAVGVLPALAGTSGEPAERTEQGPTPLTRATLEVPLPASGLYLLEVRQAGTRAVVLALVSRLALVTKQDPGGLLAFVVDRRTGLPLGDVLVEAWADGARLASGTTTADGLLRLDAPLPPLRVLRATKGEDLAYGEELYAPSEVDDLRVHVATHQPAYRPEERVEAKGVVRAWRDGGPVLSAEAREARVAFLGAGDVPLGEVTVAISPDLGTFVASCELPATAPTGEGRVRVHVGERVYEAPLRIEAYRKPAFEVVVTPATKRVLPDETLAFDVSAEFYEGGALLGAPVEWTLLYHRVDRELFPRDDLARLFFGTEREAFAPTTVAQGRGLLDQEGRLRLAVRAPRGDQDGYLTLRALVTGPDRAVVEGSGLVGYAATPLTVALRTDRLLYGAEGVARVTIRVVGADGSPAVGRAGLLAVSRMSTSQTPTGPLPEERPLDSHAFSTDGAGRALVEVPLGQDGRYALTAILARRDPEPPGPPASATLSVWAAGDRADVGYTGDHLEVVADRDVYAIGDTARLLVLAPVGARPFLATTEGTRILTHATPRLPGSDDRGAAKVVEVLIGPEHVPNAWLGVALMDQGRLLATTKLLRVPPLERVLQATARAEPSVVEPGATTNLVATVLDAAGAPVADAEVSLAVVDEALHALYADPAPTLLAYFHPLRRNGVRTGGPLDAPCIGWSSPGRREEAEEEEAESAAGGDLSGYSAPRRGGSGPGGQYRGPGGAAPPPPPHHASAAGGVAALRFGG